MSSDARDGEGVWSQGNVLRVGYRAAQWYLRNIGSRMCKWFFSLAPHLTLTFVLVSLPLLLKGIC